ncbi:hypothetical protein JCM4814A_22900 [Streptomyces phaeofaciens JCM 4814]|uniref:Uncharacterized protein n=1 Tax=Streptomyces phaeofaciens TaxID=68254 RepID=A0A918LPG6_9ACTN|nr:hypothetical protein [Streptomyces phaeofaciens]GGT34592.1 hypothetical protein GCM10010226_08240 [Streptomyces phaeofaciens]
MGERLNDTGEPGRRRAHPAGPASHPAGRDFDPVVEVLLAGALREPAAGPEAGGEGEARAVAAFRAARDTGAHHSARTRRRDDWRPRTRRTAAHPLRATVFALIGSLALGGVAFAAIGSSSSTDDDRDAGRPRQSASTSEATSAAPSPTASADGPARRERPVTAKDTAAHCRAYERVRGRGRAMDSTAWQRLVTAAGGEENVTAYCAELTASASASASAQESESAGNGKAKGGGNGQATPKAGGSNGKGQ